MGTSVVCLVIFCIVESSLGAEWNYGNKGPSTWGCSYEFCKASSQSPISIVPEQTVFDSRLGEFTPTMFEQAPQSMTLTTQGHNLEVKLNGAWTISNPALLPGSFEAVQFHFHWGDQYYTGGSEHHKGNPAFAEMHIVHYNKMYPNISVAASKSDGLAVLAFFIETSASFADNSAFESRLFQPIRDSHVMYKGDTYQYPQEWPVSELLPPKFKIYYRYKGSLTTPPCYESVTWTVFDESIKISQSQARFLANSLYKYNRTVTPAENHKLFNNYRPVQPLHGRTVYRSDPTRAEPVLVFTSSWPNGAQAKLYMASGYAKVTFPADVLEVNAWFCKMVARDGNTIFFSQDANEKQAGDGRCEFVVQAAARFPSGGCSAANSSEDELLAMAE